MYKKKIRYKNKYRMQAIFLDRDGTINYDSGYTHKFSEFKFRPNIIKGLRYLSKNNYLIFIITNQAGVAKKKFKLSDLIKLNKQLINFLKKRKIIINKIEFCLFHPDSKILKYKKKSNYRKPGNLMIKKVFKEWNIDRKRSFMIGDSVSDKKAAKKSKLYFEYVKKDFLSQIRNIEKKINNY